MRALRGVDVFSFNIYRYAPARATLDRLYALAQRPILIGEFHIGVPERGLAPGLVQAMNQEERGAAYRYYVEQGAAHPALVGAHWFQWLDQPVTGRNDGENYNIGFVDVTDRPYAELVAAAKATHARLLDVHRGKTPPVARVPMASAAGTPPMKVPAPYSLDTSRIPAVSLAPYTSRQVRRTSMAQRPREFQIFAKPAGAICNLDCHYCYYLQKEQLYPETRTLPDGRRSAGALHRPAHRHDAGGRDPVLVAWR